MLSERIEDNTRFIAAVRYTDTVVERLKQIIDAGAGGVADIGLLMGVVRDAHSDGWIAGQEKQNAEIRADFVGGSPAGVQASC